MRIHIIVQLEKIKVHIVNQINSVTFVFVPRFNVNTNNSSKERTTCEAVCLRSAMPSLRSLVRVSEVRPFKECFSHKAGRTYAVTTVPDKRNSFYQYPRTTEIYYRCQLASSAFVRLCGGFQRCLACTTSNRTSPVNIDYALE